MASRAAVTRNRSVTESRAARERRQLLQRQSEQRREGLRAASDAAVAQRAVQDAEAELQRAGRESAALKADLARVEADRGMLEAERTRAADAVRRKLRAADEARAAAATALHEREEEAFEAQQRVDSVDRALTRDRHAAREAAKEEAAEEERTAIVALARSKREAALVRAAERRQAEAAAAIAEAQQAAAMEVSQRMATAAAASRRAASRMAEAQASVAPAERAAAAMEAETRQARTASLLQLRRSLMAVERDVRTSAAGVRAAREAKLAAQQAEAASLLEAGKNPYSEFRRRERDAAAQRAKEDAAAAIERHGIALTDAMVAEAAAERRRQQREQQRAREAAAIVGPTAPGAAAKAYLASRTRGGTDLLDPTGRAARIDPSAVTAMRTHAFGTGRVAKERPDILRAERRRPEMQGVQPDERWLPRRVHHPDDPSDDEDDDGHDDGHGVGAEGARLGAGSAGGKPGAASAAGEGSAAAGAMAATRGTSLGGARGLADMTPLEQQLMAQARERIRQGRTGAQVVLGREFKGASMVPHPRTINFRDFDPGQEHRIRLTLTNGSLSFVSLRLLPLPDDITDMFEVKFKPPGRMSAGTSVPVTVIFRPPVSLNSDVTSELVVDTSTGPCPVPLTCSPKRALPVAESPVVSLGPVVRGEVVSGAATLRNEGALPVRWQLLDAGPADGGAAHDAGGGGGGGGGGGNGEGEGAGDAGGNARAGGPSGSAGHLAAEAPLPGPDGGQLGPPEADGLSAAGPWRVRASGRLAGYASCRVRAECRPLRGSALGRIARRFRVVFRIDVGAEGEEDDAGGAEARAMLGTLGRTTAREAARAAAPRADLTEAEEIAAARAEAKVTVARRRQAAHVPPLDLLFTAEVKPLALFVAPDSADLRICEVPLPAAVAGRATPADAPETAYRATVFLRNRGTTAMRVSLSVPEELRPWLEARPSSCYVQAAAAGGAVSSDSTGHGAGGGSAGAEAAGVFRVTLQLRPTAELLTSAACRRFFPDDPADLPSSRAACRARLAPPGVVGSMRKAGSFCELRAPLTVRAAGQTLAVRFRLAAALCMRGLLLQPPRLDMGNVPVGRAQNASVALTNLSALPVRFGPGARLPRDVRFAAGSGMGLLLAGETLPSHLVFAPSAAEAVSGSVQLRTSAGEWHSIAVSGQGVRPLVKLSAARLCLPATSPGETVEAAVAVTSCSGVSVDVQVVGAGSGAGGRAAALAGLPDGLTLSPAVFRLAPGERRLVRAVFAPTALPDEDERSGAASPTSAPNTDRSRGGDEPGDIPRADEEAKDVDAEDAPRSGGDSDAGVPRSELAAPGPHRDGRRPDGLAPLSLVASARPDARTAPLVRERIDPGVRESRVWLAVRPAAEAKAAGAPAESVEAALGPRGQLLVVDLQTAVVPARLLVSSRLVKFGRVPAGRSCAVEVTVECAGALPVTLEAAGLNPGGAFRVVNAPRRLQPGRSASLTVEFKPTAQRAYADVLRLRAAEGGGTVLVRLAGTGATPDVGLRGPASEPPAEGGAEGGRALVPHVDLQLGDIMAGDEAVASAELVNNSDFAMQFLATPGEAAEAAHGFSALTNRGGFAITPSAGTARPATAIPLVAAVRADTPSLGRWLGWTWAVAVPNYDGPPLSISARARVWARQGFVAAGEGAEEARAHLERLSPTLRGAGRAGDDATAEADAAAPGAVSLMLDACRAGPDSPATATLSVGCCKRPAEAESSPVSFRVELPAGAEASSLVVEPDSGTVAAGEVATVRLTLRPPEPEGEAKDCTEALAALVPASKPARAVELPLLVHLQGGAGAPEGGVAVRVLVHARMF
ncbi:hypothetical protein FNF31_01041 [Cafeteria roenbergensis]|uniref:CFAP74 fourth Ig-like domain-containing protein n=1 Tax=Cafeteria roenbergensis TaxID=33653 RepID=A0A5A8DP06_CAFRO|nr:hypothetical protein FNF31_01041 [Cafeteria roenbergensis]